MKGLFPATIVIPLMVVLAVPTAFAWEIERPSSYVIINRKASEGLESSKTDQKGCVSLGVSVATYHENEPEFPSYGNDYVKLKFATLTNTRQIINYGMQADGYSWHESSELPNQLYVSDDGGHYFEPK
jgi:hypothetical protein